MKLTDVIRRPLITEKTTVMREDGRTVVFEVARDANKIEIKQAVEKLLGAKVVGRSHRQRAWQDEAPGQVSRPPLRLEKGVREAQEGRSSRISWRGLESSSSVPSSKLSAVFTLNLNLN